jgi:hypothetical protein
MDVIYLGLGLLFFALCGGAVGLFHLLHKGL